jgi:hypothetical protein
MIAPDRLHPETLRTLRELAKLHGAPRLIEALRAIDAESPTRTMRDQSARDSAKIAKLTRV